MYKNPQASEQAKRLGEIHSQSLEILARLQGHRTLHVAQARGYTGVNILVAARAQAAAVMFADYGPFKGNPQRLYEALLELQRMDEQGRKSDLGARFQELFLQAPAIKLLPPYDYIPSEKLASAFEALTQKLVSTLAEVADAPVPSETLLHRGALPDSRVADGMLFQQLPEWQRWSYIADVNRYNSHVQLDVIPEDCEELEGMPQLQVFVGVYQGLPCVQLSNTVFGDTVLSVFATPSGLYLEPGGSDLTIRTGPPGENLPDLLQLKQDLEASYDSPAHMSMNHAFIEAANI